MLARIFFLVLGVGLGCSVAQGPEFVQQYMQRLGGHVDELSGFVQRFDESAVRSGMTRGQAIEELNSSGSPFVQSRGRDAQLMIGRQEGLNVQHAALMSAGPFERMVVLAQTYDPEIAIATMAGYRPAIPATAEGFLLGALGFFFGYMLGEFLVGLGRWGMRRSLARSVRAGTEA